LSNGSCWGFGGELSRDPKGPAQPALTVNSLPGCPLGDPLCGFAAGMTVVVYDETGNVGAFTIALAGIMVLIAIARRIPDGRGAYAERA
jgi:hypothetical protein